MSCTTIRTFGPVVCDEGCVGYVAHSVGACNLMAGNIPTLVLHRPHQYIWLGLGTTTSRLRVSVPGLDYTGKSNGTNNASVKEWKQAVCEAFQEGSLHRHPELQERTRL